MSTLKSIYFYFLAVQIYFIKSIKKIYYTTNVYNKSLVSKNPQQFFFYPNPFLLNLITTYKKNLFRISDINLNDFWVKQKNIYEEKRLNSFLWLSLIDRKSESKHIQKIINVWILKNSKYKKNIWDNSLISRRIISWIMCSDIITDNCSFDFKKNFMISMVSQVNHLKSNIKFERDYSIKLEMIVTLILSGLVFKEYKNNFNFGIKELEKLIKNYFDNDGFPLSRNPSELVFFLKFLILIKECIQDAQEYIPDFLHDIITKCLYCLKIIITPNNQVPLFNGGVEENLSVLNDYLKKSSLDVKEKKIVGGIQVIKNKNNKIFFDVGAPPNKSYSNSYQSAPLSFEYYLDNQKIITNCGFGHKISNKAELLSRLTSAHTTIIINDTSVTKFERNRLINKVFGNSIKNTFKINKSDLFNDKSKISAVSSHNGYEKKYGCTLKREISIDKNLSEIKGCDEIIKIKDGKPVNYNIRFHLYPGLNAVKTMSGNNVLIQISKNKSLIFQTSEDSILLEKSIFLGRNKILDNTCISIAGNLVNKNKTIHWKIIKNA